MSPTMAENQKPPEISTPALNPQHPPRRSRPRVREVASRFMSPSVTTSSDSHLTSSSSKSPSILNPNPNPRSVPSTPSLDSHHSRIHPLRRSNTDQRHHHRFADENRPDSHNRSSVSPVRTTSKPRSAVKLFKEPSARPGTPMTAVSCLGPARLAHHRTWDTAASKLLQAANGMGAPGQHQGDDVGSENGDCESVKSEPCDMIHNNGSGNGGDNGGRVSTPFSRSMDHPFGEKGGGGNNEKGLTLMRSSCNNKVARSLNLPPMHQPPKPAQGGSVDVNGKKGVKTKGLNQQEEFNRLRLLHNCYLQWRFANAKAEASMRVHKRESERQLYSLGVKISELQESVKSKCAELEFLRRMKTISTILDTQMPYLDEWSALEEEYSSSLLALSQGLMHVSSQLPLVGNIRADVKEIEEALNCASKAIEVIFSQVQKFMPKAEEVDCLISNLARVYNGEVELVEECGSLLSKTHLSQVEECSLRGQLIQFHGCNLTQSKEQEV